VAHFTGQIDGVPVAATHGHQGDQLQAFIRSGRYDYVFHGHTHRRRDERVGDTRVINPGALGGVRYENRSVAILDLTRGALESLPIAAW
jgi:predicted phosphodiesterase